MYHNTLNRKKLNKPAIISYFFLYSIRVLSSLLAGSRSGGQTNYLLKRTICIDKFNLGEYEQNCLGIGYIK